MCKIHYCNNVFFFICWKTYLLEAITFDFVQFYVKYLISFTDDKPAGTLK